MQGYGNFVGKQNPGCKQVEVEIKQERFFNLNSEEKLFEKRIWRVNDVARFLGCSRGHIYNLCSDEKIPKIKKGKFVYFIPDHILNWVTEGDLI